MGRPPKSRPPKTFGEGRKAANRRVLLAPLPSKRKPTKAAMSKSRTNPLHHGNSAIDAVRGGGETTAMRIALYQPDIPQNTGTILRLAACLGVEAHIVEPAGFPTSDRAFRRAGMNYLDQVKLVRHASWLAFESWRRSQDLRLILFTTGADA